MGITDIKSLLGTKSLNKGERKPVQSSDDSFRRLLKQEAQEDKNVRFSKHAQKRLEERKISLDGDEYLKLKEGINKLKEKGGRDSLIVTNEAAYIVDVDNEMVVTAFDKEDMSENVVTKIDSTLFIN